MKYRQMNLAQAFTCRHCKMVVNTHPDLSGVKNRNHCPYCLHSRHLDLWQPGDRLSACKGLMLPVGLTIKATNKRYPCQGELMLVHRCTDCGAVSINRLAADDLAEQVYRVYVRSWDMGVEHARLQQVNGIRVLDRSCQDEVRRQLFGNSEYVDGYYKC